MKLITLIFFFSLSSLGMSQTVDIDSIDANYHRILAMQNWDKTENVSPENESSEGGDINYYYTNNELEKITVDYFGEMGKSSKEFYLMNGELSFVYEITYNYNRPIYYDSVAAAENEDTEFFELKKSKVEVKSTYLTNGILLNQIPEIAFDSNIREAEAERLMTDFEKLLNSLETE